MALYYGIWFSNEYDGRYGNQGLSCSMRGCKEIGGGHFGVCKKHHLQYFTFDFVTIKDVEGENITVPIIKPYIENYIFPHHKYNSIEKCISTAYGLDIPHARYSHAEGKIYVCCNKTDEDCLHTATTTMNNEEVTFKLCTKYGVQFGFTRHPPPRIRLVNVEFEIMKHTWGYTHCKDAEENCAFLGS